MEGYLRSQHSPRRSPRGPQIKKAATRQHLPVFYPSCISRVWIKQSMVYSSRRWQKTLPQVGRMFTGPILRMCNMFCPSINMTKLITNKWKSNEMIVTKVTCPQRTMIVLPLGMYTFPKMKMQDAQLTQVSGFTTGTDND